MKYSIITFLIFNALLIHAQNNFHIGENAQVTMIGDAQLVLQNTNFTNNGTFTATAGTVTMNGDAASTIGGASAPQFNNLVIDKSANNSTLISDATVSNQLTLTNGKLDISDYNLTMGSSGTINYTTAAYVQTSGLGSLVQEVDSSPKDFPVGVNQLNFMTLSNAGTLDNFSVRCEEGVLSDGDSGNLLTEDVVDITWHVNEATEGGSDVSMTATWYANEELTNFDRTNCFIWHYTNAAWTNGTAQAATGSDPYYITQNNVTTFSPFAVASSGALPIKLLSLVALPKEDKVQLEWTTATEINSDYFEVEHSTDPTGGNGQAFKKIGQVQAAGHSSTKLAYDFLHHQPVEGMNYYRLKQVDKTGKFEYSAIVSVDFNVDNVLADINIYPNPTMDFVYLELSAVGNYKLSIFDNTGKLLRQVANVQAVDMRDLAVGVYYLKIEDVDGQSRVERVILQR